VLLGAASVIIAFLFDPAMNSYYCFRFGTPYCEDTITLEQIIQIVTDWQNATIRNLSMAVIIGGIGGYFAGGIVSGFTGRVVEMRTAPNQGIRRSARNAIRIGYAAITILILVWLPILLTAGGFRLLENRLLGWPILGIFAAFLAPLIGFLLALSAGGNAVIKHGFLRFILRRRGDIPTNYARFLDYAGSIGILRKVGGGYIFVHRYLLEYFAELKS
jgi:hypothetical protein